jgi:hypothetical protein
VGVLTIVCVLVKCVLEFTVFCIVSFIYSYIYSYLSALVSGLLPQSENSIAFSNNNNNNNNNNMDVSFREVPSLLVIALVYKYK